MLNVNEIREQFLATREWVYMDVAAQSIIVSPVRIAINKYIDEIQNNGWAIENQWFEKIESTRKKFADLVGAKSNEITYTKNTSEGLNIIANAFPWRKGDNVVLCQDIEHPNNIYTWYNLQRLGVEIRRVPSKKGFVTPEDYMQSIDKNTRMISVSSISFAPGQRISLNRLARLCKENNIFLLVDASQSCGIFAINVKEIPVDAIVAPTYKGLLGLQGMGFLYCCEDWFEYLHPVYLAKCSIETELNNHEDAMNGLQYKLHQSGRRFEIGHYNIIGIFAVEASMEYLLSIGIKNIESHVLQLSKALTKGLEDVGVEVSSGKSNEDISSIVTIGKWGEGEHYKTSDPKIAELYDYLISQRVKLSIRKGLIRFSLHLYNTLEEINQVLNLIELKQ